MLAGSHPDVIVTATETSIIPVSQARELVHQAQRHPAGGRWRVMLVEDADRLNEPAFNALLKAVEEPPPRTVWLLCAPTPHDVVVTIRSRSRSVSLTTPAEAAIAALLESRDGVPAEMAAHAARVAQGHIGRARAIARSEDARRRRAEILRIPAQLHTLGNCLQAATNLVESAGAEAAEATAELDVKERAALSEALGVGAKGARPRHAQAALRDLEDQQKARSKRIQRDALDRVLSELTSYYRDVFVVQTGATKRLVNADVEPDISALARRTPPERTIASLDAILAAREALETNVAPQLAMEALMIGLHA